MKLSIDFVQQVKQLYMSNSRDTVSGTKPPCAQEYDDFEVRWTVGL